MKLFRRISVLALALVLVCAFSASAFATPNFDDPQHYDEETILDVYARINMISTWANMQIRTVGLEEYDLAITCIYDFKYHDNSSDSDVGYGEIAEEHNRCSFSVSTTTNREIREFTKAVYTFDGNFTAYSGYHEYSPASVTITPN